MQQSGLIQKFRGAKCTSKSCAIISSNSVPATQKGVRAPSTKTTFLRPEFWKGNQSECDVCIHEPQARSSVSKGCVCHILGSGCPSSRSMAGKSIRHAANAWITVQ
jgi:hypothetical protein